MDVNWTKSLEWVRESEGGNDDDRDDPGGRTSRGITQREYDAYCEIAGLPKGDVWKAPDAVVDDIYHRSYWLPYGPLLPPGVDYAFFDQCVLSGPHESIKELQEALHVPVDGHIGMVTSAALSHAEPGILLDNMLALRADYDRAIVRVRPRSRKFLRGWLNRVAFVGRNAHSLIARKDDDSGAERTV